MNFLGLIFVYAAQYFAGKGMLRLFKIKLNPVAHFCISMITGVPLVSFAPCILQLMNLEIVPYTVIVSVSMVSLFFALPLFFPFRRPVFARIPVPALYEWPAIIVCFLLMVISVWRCFYLPPNARDMLSGPELIAEYTVKEKTMINSVFTIDLQSSNNYFKSPFITCLQIIYKLLVAPFGQLWLSSIALSFLAWLYSWARTRIHPVIAGILLILYLIVPDPFSYTFVMLYDYSNMVFFFLGFFYLSGYLKSYKLNELLFSAFLFGLATYIRTETLVLVVFALPLLVFSFFRQRLKPGKIALFSVSFVLFSAAFYFLCIDVFVKNFVLLPFDVGGQINKNLSDVSIFFNRFRDMNMKLMFSYPGIGSFGYYFHIFAVIFLADLIFVRQYNHEARIALYGFALIYFGLPFLGYLLPPFDLFNTTKRGLFKAIPLAFWYMCNSGILLKLSALVYKWEEEPKEIPKPVDINIKRK